MTDKYRQPALDAIAAWESYGAPIAGYGEDTRRDLRAYAERGGEEAAIGQSQNIYILAKHLAGRAKLDAANQARIDAVQNRRRARNEYRQTLTDEMRSIRADLGLTQQDMDRLLGLKITTCNDFENPDGSIAIERVEAMLGGYQVRAKLAAGTPAAVAR